MKRPRAFTVEAYDRLLAAWMINDCKLFGFQDYLETTNEPRSFVILRHDVDRKPENALKIARLQSDLGIHGTYYFRIVPESFQTKYIEAIAELGHEIGYHYEDLTICKGDIGRAIKHFERSLNRLREITPISTICMHGSPMTKWDNRDLWKHYDYHDFGIIGEPYFDVNFDEVYYLTDTGRRWDGHKVSVRDTVSHSFDFNVRSTWELIKEIENGRAPKRMMQNIHPERWTDDTFEWSVEYIKSAIKNPVKKFIKEVRS